MRTWRLFENLFLKSSRISLCRLFTRQLLWLRTQSFIVQMRFSTRRRFDFCTCLTNIQKLKVFHNNWLTFFSEGPDNIVFECKKTSLRFLNVKLGFEFESGEKKVNINVKYFHYNYLYKKCNNLINSFKIVSLQFTQKLMSININNYF